MNTKTRYALILSLALLVAAALAAVAWAAPRFAPQAAGAPEMVAYQGEVRVGGVPYDGDGYFKFAVVRALGSTTYWSNDGTSVAGSPPSAAVMLPVDDGLFSVLLGDTTLTSMTHPLTAAVFSAPERYLRVWFSDSILGPFDQLGPDTRIASVPYAMNADTVDGLHADDLRTRYGHVVVVAKSGGDYTSVQAAIDYVDGIGDAAADNPYLVWVAPGEYEGPVAMKAHVHLQGAGQDVTIITSDVYSDTWPPTVATLLLASDTSLRDLTVASSGAVDSSAALLAGAGVSNTTVGDVTARAVGTAAANYAIAVVDSPTRVALQRVTALAENGSTYNIGLLVSTNARAVLRGGNYTARGGDRAFAVSARDGATVEADGVTMLAENGEKNAAMNPYDGADVVLRGGDYTARGGLQTNGISCQLNSTVTATDVTVLAENGTDNYGMGAYDGGSMTVRGASVTARGGNYSCAVTTSWNCSTLDAESVVGLAEDAIGQNLGLYVGAGCAHATVRGGSFTGRGGQDAKGIFTEESEVTLYAEGATALGEDGSSQIFGLYNTAGAQVTLLGGSYTGRGTVEDSYGIANDGTGSRLSAESVTALGEDGTHSFGLRNIDSATATLSGGSFTGRGGDHAHGLCNTDAGAFLQAANVTALGAGGGTTNTGLLNQGGAEAVLRGGDFSGSGGPDASGIHNDGDLYADRVSVLGFDASGGNYGIYNVNGTAKIDSSQLSGTNHALYAEAGTVRVGVSLLEGGAGKNTGTLNCFQVYDASYTAYSCP